MAVPFIKLVQNGQPRPEAPGDEIGLMDVVFKQSEILSGLSCVVKRTLREWGQLSSRRMVEHQNANLKIQLESAQDPRPGSHAKLTISDTGPGLEPVHFDRIIEPFKSARSAAGGTRLGLSMVRDMVLDHGGDITVESPPGRGTIFRVYLLAEAGRTPDKEKVRRVKMVKGSELVLFVDGDQTITQLGKSMFERNGYRVTPRTNGIEALTTFRANYAKFDIIVTDQCMPGLSGVELITAIRRIRSDIPAILFTCPRASIDIVQTRELGIADNIISKPFLPHELIRAIRKALKEGACSQR